MAEAANISGYGFKFLPSGIQFVDWRLIYKSFRRDETFDRKASPVRFIEKPEMFCCTQPCYFCNKLVESRLDYRGEGGMVWLSSLAFSSLVKKCVVDKTLQRHVPTKRTASMNRLSMKSCPPIHISTKTRFEETIGILRKIWFSLKIASVSVFPLVKNATFKKSKDCRASIVPRKLAHWQGKSCNFFWAKKTSNVQVTRK